MTHRKLVAALALAGCAQITTDEDHAALEEAACTPGIRYFEPGIGDSFTVPAGCTVIRVKAWGAGGRAGPAWGNVAPVSGGGGGFVRATLAVTPGEKLAVQVNGGGRTTLQRGSTPLVVAASGGAAGVKTPDSATGRGGAGGGLVGQAGETVQINGNTAGGGQGGTQTAGGAGGWSSTNHHGGAGTAVWGGAPYPNAGAGGDGLFGGGGGAATWYGNGGGGGGSSFFVGDGITIGGTWSDPGAVGDPDRNGAGQGGTATLPSTGGRMVIWWGDTPDRDEL